MSEDKTLYNTKQAAAKLGTSHNYLRVIIQRHPELAPAKLSDAWAWTDEDISRVQQYFERTRTEQPQ